MLWFNYEKLFIASRGDSATIIKLLQEKATTAWVQPTEYEIPMFTTPAGGASKGTIMDYMGIPISKAGIEFSQLGLRAYIKTYNEWFRDQNLIAPITDIVIGKLS